MADLPPATPVSAPGRAAGPGPTLVTAGFALLALAGVLGVLSLSSAELENNAQASSWGTASFVVGLLGALSAVLGAFLRRRAEASA